LNEGARQSNSEHILFLHADVFPPVSFADEINSVLTKEVDFGIFAYQFNSSKLMLKFNSHLTKYDLMMSGGGDQCHFMTKSCFNTLGGYDTSYDIMEDFEFFDRVKQQKFNYKIVASKATVSARKYDNYSWFWVNLINTNIFLRYKLGVSPNHLKRSYNKWMSRR